MILRPLKYLFIIGACVWLAACGDDRLAHVSSDSKILAFGDSLTAGVGASTDKDYPSILAELSGAEVVNAGISGEVTMQGLARFKTILGLHRPHVVILLEGGNDILRKLNLAQTKHNLAQMIEIAKAKRVKVVLVGVPNKLLFSDAAPLYGELAEMYDVIFIEDTLASLLKEPAMKSDGVHLNDDGYAQLAQSIYETLIDYGAFTQ